MLAACHELGIPVTPRGTGTGNYGQAMPLSGGVLLDLSGFNKVREIAAGRYVAEPGAIILFHVGAQSEDALALGRIIEGLRAQGYQLVGLSDLLGL